MTRRIVVLVAWAGLLFADTSAAFTTAGGAGVMFSGTPAGHERLTWYAGMRAGGVFAEPSVNEIADTSTLCGALCRQYGTQSWRTWSAIMGDRWTDIGPYRLDSVRQLACFHAAIQESDDVQYAHALRMRCDVGLDGVRRTHRGTVGIIRARFMASVSAPDNTMLIRDGGATSATRIVRRPYFFLGMALHTLQDSFSQEHTTRDATWHTLTNFNTYVDTSTPDKVTRHSTVVPADGDLIGKSALATISDDRGPNAWWNNLRPSAQAAVIASIELMQKFEAARSPGANADQIWSEFESHWLRLVPDARASVAETPDMSTCTGKHDGQKTEQTRASCLADTGIERSIADIHYPRFCWGDVNCPP